MAKKKSPDPAAAPAPRPRAAASTPKSTTRKKSASAAGSLVIEQTVTRITYTPSADEIAEAAYHRFLSRGGHHGGDFDDWLEAERELRERQG